MSDKIITTSKRWDLSMEMLKAIAAILVMNSHMDAMYGDYSYLGTGGSIGDALFFFCSGYTLFLSNRKENFFNWYKRRFQRIFPSVFICSLLVATYGLKPQQPITIVNLSTIWFIYCIMIYYVLLYPIKRYASKYIGCIMGAVVVATILYYFMVGVEPLSSGNIYGGTYLKWVYFFFFMLFGAVCGRWRLDSLSLVTKDGVQKSKLGKPNVAISSICLFICILAFYSIYFCTRSKPEYEPYQLFSLIPLVGVCWFLWRFACTDFSVRLMQSKYLGFIIRFIGGLCLEILLCQGKVFTTELNHLFPLNILIIMMGVILLAYVVRIFSRLFLQTFQSEDYDWKNIVAPV